MTSTSQNGCCKICRYAGWCVRNIILKSGWRFKDTVFLTFPFFIRNRWYWTLFLFFLHYRCSFHLIWIYPFCWSDLFGHIAFYFCFGRFGFDRCACRFQFNCSSRRYLRTIVTLPYTKHPLTRTSRFWKYCYSLTSSFCGSHWRLCFEFLGEQLMRQPWDLTTVQECVGIPVEQMDSPLQPSLSSIRLVVDVALQLHAQPVAQPSFAVHAPGELSFGLQQ